MPNTKSQKLAYKY